MANPHRLQRSIIPINYEITVKPDFKTYLFDGSVKIDLTVNTITNVIKLNSSELNLKTASYESNSKVLKSTKIEIDTKYETAAIHFSENIQKGSGILSITFDGVLNDRMVGFYRVKYKHNLAKDPYTATTQFETCDARKCFPCWDEPDFKATFDVIIITDPSKTVLSNMPVKQCLDYEDDKSLKKYIFERSPIMSTYLVAFVIGEYDCIEGTLDNGAPLRVYTPLNQRHMGEFTFDIAKKSVKFYSDYFGIEYALPKLDLIAVPENPIEAMENFGLIICNEANSLLDQANCSLGMKLVVAFIITHEIAHQWFGNLVTMEWWTDLWLNEGFATWAAYLCTEYCLKDVDIWTSFIESCVFNAFELDSLSSTHPIEVPVQSPDEINEIFDSISYDKGASILRMLREYIGHEAFQNGVHNYLNAFRYANARTDQLWDYLGATSNKAVTKFMQGWTKTDGYPLVQVTSETNSDGHTLLHLRQQRFFIDTSFKDENIWQIPIKIYSKSTYPNTVAEIFMDTKTTVVDIGVVQPSDWILLNSEVVGFYRTLYSSEMFNRLKNSIERLNPRDRLAQQNNAFALASAGFLPIVELLEFVKCYKDETDPYVWKDLTHNLLQLSSLLINTNYHEKYRQFVINLCKPLSSKLGWKIAGEDDYLANTCREYLHYTLVVMSDEESCKEAKHLFLTHKNYLPSYLKRAVYSSIITESKGDTLDYFFDLYEKTDIPEERMLLLKVLREARTPEAIKRVLDFSLQKAAFEDAVLLMNDIPYNPCSSIATKMTWQFVKDNWNEIVNRYGKQLLLGRLVKPIISQMKTIEETDDVKAFFAINQRNEAEKAVSQGSEMAIARAKWLTKICNELSSSNYNF